MLLMKQHTQHTQHIPIKHTKMGKVDRIEENKVRKRVTYPSRKTREEAFEREIFWLNKLKDTGIIIELLSYERKDDQLIIYSKYYGKAVTNETLPDDWEEQRDHIIKILRENNCRHNDIKPGEILINKEEKIALCDFGFAWDLDKPNPPHWPNRLGLSFRPPQEMGFGYESDLYSFNKVIKESCGVSPKKRNL